MNDNVLKFYLLCILIILLFICLGPRQGAGEPVSVEPLPDKTVAEVNEPVTFIANTTWNPNLPVSKFTWDFDETKDSDNADGDLSDHSGGADDMEAMGKLVTHSYDRVGIYRITLSVKDQDEVIRTGCEVIVISNSDHNPVVNFTPREKEIGSLTVRFDGSGSYDPDGHPLTFHWDFGDGYTCEIASPSHTYEHPGTYDVKLRASDGTKESQRSSFVTILGESGAATQEEVPGGERGENGMGSWSSLFIGIMVVVLIAVISLWFYSSYRRSDISEMRPGIQRKRQREISAKDMGQQSVTQDNLVASTRDESQVFTPGISTPNQGASLGIDIGVPTHAPQKVSKRIDVKVPISKTQGVSRRIDVKTPISTPLNLNRSQSNQTPGVYKTDLGGRPSSALDGNAWSERSPSLRDRFFKMRQEEKKEELNELMSDLDRLDREISKDFPIFESPPLSKAKGAKATNTPTLITGTKEELMSELRALDKEMMKKFSKPAKVNLSSWP